MSKTATLKVFVTNSQKPQTEIEFTLTPLNGVAKNVKLFEYIPPSCNVEFYEIPTT